MPRPSNVSRCVTPFLTIIAIAAVSACTSTSSGGASSSADMQVAQGSQAQVLLGRSLVINHDCGGCHGGFYPGDKGWLAGVMNPLQEFYIGACYVGNPTAKPCFITRPRNLTPDNTTGLGRFSERQIFNSLRFGLRPEETPDVEITSMTPGQGNFPANPRYLAPPMPWTSWRHMSDQELWAMAAYLKRGLKPVSNKVLDSEGPRDFWASTYTVANIGPYPGPAYPTVNER